MNEKIKRRHEFDDDFENDYFYSKIDDEIEYSINNITSDSDGDEVKHSVDELSKNLCCWSPRIDVDEEIDIKLF